MIQVADSHFEVIFCFTNRKRYYFQVNKATIQVVEWQLKVFFCHMTSPKFDFGEVEKAMFQVVACHFNFIIGLWTRT